MGALPPLTGTRAARSVLLFSRIYTARQCGCNRSLPAIVRVRAWSYAICCPCFLRRSVSLSLRGTHAGTPYLPALLAFGRFSFGRCGAYFRETSRAAFFAFGVFSFLNMSKSAFFYSQRVASFAARRAVKMCKARKMRNRVPFAVAHGVRIDKRTAHPLRLVCRAKRVCRVAVSCYFPLSVRSVTR